MISIELLSADNSNNWPCSPFSRHQAYSMQAQFPLFYIWTFLSMSQVTATPCLGNVVCVLNLQLFAYRICCVSAKFPVQLHCRLVGGKVSDSFVLLVFIVH